MSEYQKSLLRIFLGVVISVLVIITVVVTICRCTSNRGEAGRVASKPVYMIMKPIYTVLYKITDSPRFFRLMNDMEHQEFAIKREEEQVEKEDELESVKADLDSYIKNAMDLDTLMACRRFAADYHTACKKYEDAKKEIEACNSGRFHIQSNVVTDAIYSLQGVKKMINSEINQVQSRRVYLSAKDRIKENTKRLGFLLNQAGLGYKVSMESFGFNKNEKGEYRTLVMNGFLQYEPGDAWERSEYCFQELGFTEKKTPESDLEICLLKSQKNDRVSLWGKMADFNFEDLKYACALRDKYKEYNGVYAQISFGFHTGFCIPCNRISTLRNYDVDCDVVVVDLRPQKPIRWSLCYAVDDSKVRSVTENSGNVSVIQPMITSCYGRANMQYKHLPIEMAVHRPISGNVSMHGDITETLNPSVSEVLVGDSGSKEKDKKSEGKDEATSKTEKKKVIQLQPIDVKVNKTDEKEVNAGKATETSEPQKITLRPVKSVVVNTTPQTTEKVQPTKNGDTTVQPAATSAQELPGGKRRLEIPKQ